MRFLQLLLLLTISVTDLIAQSTTITAGTGANINVPQLTYNQIITIASPQKGMTVFDTSSNILRYYNGTEWVANQNANTYASGSTIRIDGMINANNPNSPQAIVNDKDGNIITAGTFNGTLYMNNNCSVPGNSASFISKKSKNNTCMWTKTINYTEIKDIKLDDAGNIYVTGSFGNISSTAFSEHGVTLYSNGGRDIFIAKFSANGTFQWAKNYGSAEYDRPFSLAIGNNNIYITGNWDGNAIDSQHKLFIGRYDLNGSQLSLQVYNSSATGFKVLTDTSTGLYYVGGRYWGSFDVQGTYFPEYSSFSFFIICFDNNNNIVWAKSGKDVFNDMAMDNQKNIYATGIFHSNLSIEGINLTADGTTNIFIFKISKSGKLDWVTQLGKTPTYEGFYGYDIEVDEQNNLYIGGVFYQTLILGSTVFKSYGGSDFFVAKLNNSAQLQWIQRGGGTKYESIERISISKDGIVFAFGAYGGNMEVNGLELAFEGEGYYGDLFVLQLAK